MDSFGLFDPPPERVGIGPCFGCRTCYDHGVAIAHLLKLFLLPFLLSLYSILYQFQAQIYSVVHQRKSAKRKQINSQSGIFFGNWQYEPKVRLQTYGCLFLSSQSLTTAKGHNHHAQHTELDIFLICFFMKYCISFIISSFYFEQ